MSEKKDLKVAPEAKALPDEALEGVAGGADKGVLVQNPVQAAAAKAATSATILNATGASGAGVPNPTGSTTILYPVVSKDNLPGVVGPGVVGLVGAGIGVMMPLDEVAETDKTQLEP